MMLKNSIFYKLNPFRLISLCLINILLVNLIFFIPVIAIPDRTPDIDLDGVITDNEYSYSQILSEGDFILYWKAIGNEIYFAMEGGTTGWIALGINPSFMMLGADMVFGWVLSNGSVEIVDAYATGPTGPHPADIDLGGSDDILDYNGSEVDQKTIIEFKRLLITPDTDYDNSIPVEGSVKFLWALGTSDLFDAQHAKRGSLQWSLEGASSFKADFSQPFILGFSLFITSSGLLIFVDSQGREKSLKKSEKGDQ
ncbi:MAG: DOMON domain-containing protein [Candidatus Hodarchaeales archaeon]